jgi:hypothetical protein
LIALWVVIPADIAKVHPFPVRPRFLQGCSFYISGDNEGKATKKANISGKLQKTGP